MKLLKFVSSLPEAKIIRQQLESQGILTFIANDNSKGMIEPIGAITNTTKIGVWVIVDEQYDDAVHVVENPVHEFTQPTNEEELEEREEIEEMLGTEMEQDINIHPSIKRLLLLWGSALLVMSILICIAAYLLRASYH
jgi:CRISPR/Cas system CSM-associated protein Csm5 (group 7 of RAMP superfamily)